MRHVTSESSKHAAQHRKETGRGIKVDLVLTGDKDDENSELLRKFSGRHLIKDVNEDTSKPIVVVAVIPIVDKCW